MLNNKYLSISTRIFLDEVLNVLLYLSIMFR